MNIKLGLLLLLIAISCVAYFCVARKRGLPITQREFCSLAVASSEVAAVVWFLWALIIAVFRPDQPIIPDDMALPVVIGVIVLSGHVISTYNSVFRPPLLQVHNEATIPVRAKSIDGGMF